MLAGANAAGRVAGVTPTTHSRPAAPQPELRDALAAARLSTLRRRLNVLSFTAGFLLFVLSMLAYAAVRDAYWPRRLGVLGPAIGGVVMVVVGFVRSRRGSVRRQQLPQIVRRSISIVVISVAVQIPAAGLVAAGMAQAMTRAGFTHVRIGGAVPLLVSLPLIHVAEAAAPVAILLALALCLSPLTPDPWPAVFGGLLALALAGLPGVLVTWLKQGRLRGVVELGFFSDRYAETQRELAYARRIHEKAFPAPLADGPVRFDYRYEPMSQIGGDFVDLIRDGEDVTALLVDVTGHGIAAAMAVNRLQGEVKRTLALDPSARPGALVAALNAYVYHTLAGERVFATAVVVRLSPGDGRVAWCSAGHPPAMIVAGNAVCRTLDATAMMLGPLPPEAFDPDEQPCSLPAGATVLAYTDGLIEVRGRDGAMLEIGGLRRLAEVGGGDLDDLMRRLSDFRSGAAEDDALALTVRFAAGA